MKYISLLSFTCCICCFYGFSQDLDSTLIFKKNGVTKSSVLSTHPFGMFFTRIQGNFKTHATRKATLNVGIESGNVWAAPVIAYIPNDNSESVLKIHLGMEQNLHLTMNH